MEVPIPEPPTELGASKGVRRRIERSIPAVRAAFGFLGVVGEALERRYGERLERARREREAGGEDDGRDDISVLDVIYGFGRELERKAEALVAADLVLEGARRRRRGLCDDRDDARGRLYRGLAFFRKTARGLLRSRRAKRVSVLKGETSRDPWHLVRQTGESLGWATGAKRPPPDFGYGLDWAKLASPLVPLRDELRPAIKAALYAGIDVDQALALRNRAMRAFDREYNGGTRALEATLNWLRLPTLAAAVRPHLKVAGRVGRPSKKPPVDAYPDLVERVRALGLLPEPEEAPAEEAPAPEPKTADEVRDDAARKSRRPPLMGAHLLKPLARPRPRPVAVGDVPGPRRSAEAPSAGAAKTFAWPARALDWWRRRRDAA